MIITRITTRRSTIIISHHGTFFLHRITVFRRRSGRRNLLCPPRSNPIAQHLHHFPHRRPVVWVPIGALHGRRSHRLQLGQVDPAGEPRVREEVPPALLHDGPGPLEDVSLFSAGDPLDGLPAGDELEEEDAEAVDVARVGHLPPHGVLRGKVAERALHTCGEVADAVGDELREPEVGDLRPEVAVEEDVAGFDVSVDDVGFGLVVEITAKLGIKK
ncbi:hypothetical protein AXF42_Ash006362 [Apostasia shenzhenica]|uniref:Uncharacterized protein n=1 Tax=Apostasia shenzhenica TaxID=1088818 RepID=A0A2I0AYW2_9ASPA|nr:hypothetical protein AXF42_Ash006362 [Apostasia shenzhenica]